MKASIYKELEPRRRFLTLGWVGAILGAHLLVFGGGYIVTQYGSDEAAAGGSTPKMSRAGANGLVTWSNQSEDAQAATVDGTSETLFDNRAGDLSGYNGEQQRPMLMAQASQSQGAQKRFEPRRPSESSAPAPRPGGSSRNGSFLRNQSNDAVLQPVGSQRQSEPVVSSSEPSSTIEYKVQNGDSLWGISQRFGVTVQEIVASNPGIKANTIRVGQTIEVPRSSGASAGTSSSAGTNPSPAPTGAVDGSVYVVKSGDSLSRIASRQGVTVSELKRANGKSNDMIRIGEELVIPNASRKPQLAASQHTGRKHVVEPGDTLSKLAAIYGASTKQIMVLNDIQDPRKIRIGQTLLIPGDTSPPPPQPTRRQPAAPVERAPVSNLPTLQTLDTDEMDPEDPRSLPSLETLEEPNEFDEDDLDEQPLIPIQ